MEKNNKQTYENRSNRGPYRRLKSGLKSAFSTVFQCFSSFSKLFLQNQHVADNLLLFDVYLLIIYLAFFLHFLETCLFLPRRLRKTNPDSTKDSAKDSIPESKLHVSSVFQKLSVFSKLFLQNHKLIVV